jgi:hypothetical protein
MCIEIGDDEVMNGFNSTDMIEFAQMIIHCINAGIILVHEVDYEKLLNNYIRGDRV